jgi:hypothetical protein
LKKLLFLLLLAVATTSSAQVPQSNHVVLVMEENHSYSSVIGSSSMPYLNSLADQYGLATNYYANVHPSIGNYFYVTTGQDVTNSDGYSGTVAVDNLAREMMLAGKTWKSYAESLPSVGYTGGDVSPYLQHHNPFAYFTDVVNSGTERLNLVPFTQLPIDLASGTLPQFSFIAPNELDDAHSGTLAQADAWLKTNIAPILASPGFQQDGLMIILFDESVSTDTANGGGHVAMVMIGPKVKPGYRSTTFYQHQSIARLIEEALGLPNLYAGAVSAPSMAEFFGSGVTPPPPPPPPPPTSSGCSATAIGVTVCTPTSGSTTTSPVQFVAAANAATGIKAMKIYVDGVGSYSVNGATLNTALAMATGTHNVTVKAWDTSGASYSQRLTLTVSTSAPPPPPPPPPSSSCTPSSTLETVTICSPANNATVSSPMQVVAASNSKYSVTAMQIYLDGTKVYQVAANAINTPLTITAGTHRVTAKAWTSAGTSFMSVVYVTAP